MGVSPAILARFSTRDPKGEWYTVIPAIAEAWRCGREAGQPAPVPPPEPPPPPVDEFAVWYQAFLEAAGDIVDSHGLSNPQRAQARSGLNGFLMALKNRRQEYEGLAVYERVDRYFKQRCLSSASEYTYRMWISKALARMEEK